VDAPDGTEARCSTPSDVRTSTSTVGLPRESMISRPCTCDTVAAATVRPEEKARRSGTASTFVAVVVAIMVGV
jgi:hypothetical protein